MYSVFRVKSLQLNLAKQFCGKILRCKYWYSHKSSIILFRYLSHHNQELSQSLVEELCKELIGHQKLLSLVRNNQSICNTVLICM